MPKAALAIVEDAAEGLSFTWRKMMGHDCLFAPGGIFALVTKDGRIGLRLPDAAAFAELRGQPGAADFAPMGRKGFAHWVLVSEELHDDPIALGRWLQRAHALSMPS
jgi:TfoX/Sxy family transcriptional regulator of competence genes